MKNLKSILTLSTLVLMLITSCSKDEDVIPKDKPIPKEVVLTIEDDRSGLIEIFKTNLQNTLNWDITSKDVSKWEGITVEDNRVTIINISNKGLETLSLVAMKKLTKLKTLVANNNNLKSVDLSENVNLERLALYKNYNFATIDVSKNIALKQLLVEECRLKKLDVSMLSKLTDLKANGNDFTSSVNVANGNNVNMTRMYASSPTLKCVQVDNIDAVTNKQGWSINPDASYSLGCE